MKLYKKPTSLVLEIDTTECFVTSDAIFTDTDPEDSFNDEDFISAPSLRHPIWGRYE